MTGAEARGEWGWRIVVVVAPLGSRVSSLERAARSGHLRIGWIRRERRGGGSCEGSSRISGGGRGRELCHPRIRAGLLGVSVGVLLGALRLTAGEASKIARWALAWLLRGGLLSALVSPLSMVLPRGSVGSGGGLVR